MAIVYADRVKEQTATSGTGTLTLSGAFSGFKTFVAGVGSGNESYYTIVDDTTNEWEVGKGTVGIGTLSRDTILSSSNGSLVVNFAAGTKTVFAVSAAQFYTQSLSTPDHAALDHTGITGVPAAETFTSTTHNGTDHTIAPFNLLDEPAHDALDHTGLTGVPAAEAFTSAAHDAVDHTIAPFNLLDEPAHDALDHTGLTGVLTTPTRSYTIELVTPSYGTTATAVPVAWSPGFTPTVITPATSRTYYPVPMGGRVVAGAINNVSGSVTVTVSVNGVSAFAFAASGTGSVTVVPGWTPFAITPGDYITVASTGSGSHEAALTMFVEP